MHPFRKKSQMTAAEFKAALHKNGFGVDHDRIVDVSGKCPGFTALPTFNHSAVNRNATLSKVIWERDAEIKRRAGSLDWADGFSAGTFWRPSFCDRGMSGLTPAPIRRVHDPSGVATHGVALWSAGESRLRSARVVIALLVPHLAACPPPASERPARAPLVRERRGPRLAESRRPQPRGSVELRPRNQGQLRK
jgi:hypothetical protein